MILVQTLRIQLAFLLQLDMMLKKKRKSFNL
jgi:hypothetical protein